MVKGKRKIDSQLVVTLITSATLTQEINDQLEGTDKFMHNLKFHSKGLNAELEKYLRAHLPKVYSADEEIYLNISRNIEELIKTMSELALKVDPADFIEMNQMMNLYLDNKEAFQEVVTPVITRIRKPIA